MSYPPPAPPPPPPNYGQVPSYGVVPAGPETHSNAIVSMVLGILGLAASCGPFTGIPAIILGYKARREIDAEPMRYGGRGMATAGIILGWIATGLCVAGGLFYLLFIVLAIATG